MDCRQGRVRSGWMFVGLLLLSRSTLCCWLGAGCLAVWLGFAKESEDPFARGALKVAALSSSDQLGFFFSLLQIESRQGFIGLSVPRMTLLLSYLCSLPCYSLHFLSHSTLGGTLLFSSATIWPCSLLPGSQISLVSPERCEFSRDESVPGSCMDSDSGLRGQLPSLCYGLSHSQRVPERWIVKCAWGASPGWWELLLLLLLSRTHPRSL